MPLHLFNPHRQHQHHRYRYRQHQRQHQHHDQHDCSHAHCTRHSFLLSVLVLTAAVIAFPGCTCAPATVNTVQPNAAPKSVFTGEWYYRVTVADVPFGTAVTFTGAQGEFERLRWRIEESYLLGYRSYQRIADSDSSTRSTAGNQADLYYGAPIVAFAIDKHFDIRRSYDHRTGEETNVIEENTEKPWYEREYMRVDWSENEAETGYEFAGIPLRVMELVSTNPTDTDAPSFDDSDGDGVVDAINLHIKALAEPDTIDGEDGKHPVCGNMLREQYDCNPSEIVLNASFLRVDPTREYAGTEYDDRWMHTFGYFDQERLTYDRRYGLTEPNRIRYTKRHNIWKGWFAKDEQGQIVCDGTDDKGSPRSGPCNGFSASESPTPRLLRYAEREVRPIAYHVNADFDPSLLEVAEQVVDSWNEPFRDTVNGLRFWECVDAGGTADSCQKTMDPDLEVFILCPHNPSQDGDPPECSTDHTGPEYKPDGTPDIARIGDLRYHFMYLIHDPLIYSPAGYGPSAGDPKGGAIVLSDGAELALGAGEIISGNAFVYGHVLDMLATDVTDMVQLINGNIAETAFVDGENVESWVKAMKSGGGAASSLAGRTFGMPDGRQQAYSADDLRTILDRMDGSWAAPLHAELSSMPAPTTPPEVSQYLARVRTALDSAGMLGGGAAEARAHWDSLLASPFDDLLWDEETLAANGYDPASLASGISSIPSNASPLDVLDPARRQARSQWQLVAAEHAVDFDPLGYSDPTLLGRALAYKQEGKSYEEIWKVARELLFLGLTQHEVGHTLGLRHNFAGSYDAFNFFPRYWELRRDGNMGPRHRDPESAAETDGRMREYMYSSIMDYHAARNSDWQGLGHWDKAAIKFGYGSLVEVLTAVPPGQVIPGLQNFETLGWIAYFNSIHTYPAVSGIRYSNGEWLQLHYTDYPAIAGDLEARVDVPFARLQPVFPPDAGKATALSDGLVVSRPAAGLLEIGMPAVPYRNCSDEYAWFGYPTCAQFDEGADPYEVVEFYVQKYWNSYILSNFKRSRYGFRISSSYLDRLDARIFEPLRTWIAYYVLLHGFMDVETDERAAEFFAADRGYGGWTAAAASSLQFLTEIITRPEPGPHALTYAADGSRYNVPTSGKGAFTIPLIAGAYYGSDWDHSGYRWYEQQSRIGVYWDKILALRLMTTTDPFGFMGLDTTTDPRKYALGFQNLWKDQIARFLSELVAGERTQYGPVFSDGELVYP
ncbi:MAG: zinc-dependent metalloprotease, partial [Pseudomonadota bacterium]